VDAELPAENVMSFAAGAQYEYALDKDISLFPRAGYNSVSEVTGFKGFTFGLGVRYKQFTFDYALVPYGDMGFVHKISVSVSIGIPVSEN
jgi:hypothetical protein